MNINKSRSRLGGLIFISALFAVVGFQNCSSGFETKSAPSSNTNLGSTTTTTLSPNTPAPCGPTGSVSEAQYLTMYPDVNTAGLNPFVHYKQFGKSEGRCPISGRCTLRVTSDEYRLLYPEAVSTGGDPAYHYEKLGYAQGYCPMVNLASQNKVCEGKSLAKIFIVAGQSNAVGLGKLEDVESGHWIRSYWRDNGFKFQYWSLRTHSDWQAGSVTLAGPHFGPELSLAASLQAKGLSNFYIYKAASGGSVLAANVNPANDWRYRGAGGLYDQTTVDLRKAADEICNSGLQPVVAGFFWMQGESDALDVNVADRYSANLTRLVTELREDVMSKKTPVVLGKIRSGADSLWIYADRVRAADESVAASHTNVRTIETNDLSYYAVECTATNGGYCKAHYDAAGLLVMGQRFFDSYEAIK